MRFEVRVTNSEQVQAALTRLGQAAPAALGDGLYRWAEMVMTDSKANYVPVDTGVLRASGHIQQPEIGPTQIAVTFGYGGAAAPYALRTHENPRAGKTEGWSPPDRKGRRRRYQHWARVGEFKYLETPFKKHVGRLRNYVAQALNQAIARSRRIAGA